MIEEEKDRLRAEKIAVTGYLSRVDISAYKLAEADERIEAYVFEVCNNPHKHNLFEQLAVKRFLSFVDKYGLDVSEVKRFFCFYESLHFPGKSGLTCYALTPVQAFQFSSVFGFWEGGRRIVREVVLFVPRKFSKTTGSAAFALYDLFFGDSNAEAYIGANSSDQAKKCFNVIRDCVKKLDPRGRRYVVNEQIVKPRRKDRIAFAQCLTANARTKDGLNASTVIMDEFSQARDSTLLSVLTTSMGARDNPLTVIITTASDVFDGPFYERLAGYKSVLLGDFEDDTLFAHLFEPDIDDAEDDPETWKKVHPHLGVTVDISFYEREYKTACRDGAEARLAFRTKLLNLYTEHTARVWISSTLARQISRPILLDNLKGTPDGMVAIDLSESDDFSAVSLGLYNKEQGAFYFKTAYFFPNGALPNHPNERLYRAWADKGHLTLTEGEVIDYRAIVGYILALNKRVRILGIGYDAWKSQEVINMLMASGASNVLRSISQTYGTFTAPVESFEHGAKTGKIFIDDNPINAYCFGNAVLDWDKLENCKPIKRKQTQKIDGVITKLMCLRLFMDYLR